MQDHAAEELHIEVPHPQHPPPRLAADGEGFDQQIVDGFARSQPFAKLLGLFPQLGVGHLLAFGLPRRDGVHLRLQLAEQPGVGGAEQRGDPAFDPPGEPAKDVTNDFQRAFQNFHDSRTALERVEGRKEATRS